MSLLRGVIVVEGNIGAGKSTLLKALANHGVHVFPEPVATWSALAEFYQNPARWLSVFFISFICVCMTTLSCCCSCFLRGFLLQVQVLTSFSNVAQEAGTSHNLLVVERSPETSILIFAKRLLDAQLLSAKEFETLKRLWDKVGWIPERRLYIRTPPAICAARVRMRGRKGEGAVSRELLEDLHERHEKLYARTATVIDGSCSTEDIVTDVLKFVHERKGKL